jgi:Domain of unknown function (DUF4411)
MYCLDTSAILHAWRRDYPPDTFPTLWSQLDEMIGNGAVIAPDEVLLELERGGDEIHAWAQGHAHMFLEPDEQVQAVVQTIVDTWPHFLPDESHDGVWADPYVVALASVHEATVVTGEVLAPDNASRPKMPNICRELDVPWTTLLGVLRSEGMTF